MFKFAGFIICGALIFVAGCSTAPRDDEPLPMVWESTNSVPHQPLTHGVRPIPAGTNPFVSSVHSNVPPQNPKPGPVPTWTSLNHWATENKLPQPKQVSELPVATYAITSPNGTFGLEIGSREATWRGMEILLGVPPEFIDGQLFVHHLDLQKTLKPLLLGSSLTFGTNRVIVIDPGHGGSNTGTHNLTDGRFEKEFTLDWAFRIRSLLETNGWKVFLTRTNDADVSLSNRVVFAEEHHANVFISLHFNSAAPNTIQNGLEIYCLTPTGMPSTLTRGYQDLWTDHYPNNEFDPKNLELAARLQSSLLHITGEEDRGIRRARFMTVLQGPKCPAVLIEGGFLSNPAEAKKIENPGFRQKLAEGVANALK